MDFPEDKNVINIADQYMFGPSLLVNPVYEYKARSRAVYLPLPSGWYDLYSGKYFKGGSHINAEAPLQRMPLYVKAGSIIPVGPVLQFTDEKPLDPVTLYVYTGKDADFQLYEDEGTNYNYENGEYTMIPFHYDESSKKLTIGERKGSYKDMLASRKFQIVWVTTDKPVGMDLNVHPDQVIEYDGQPATIAMKK
jgi:alpha-D-xyloside xylohydrolase